MIYVFDLDGTLCETSGRDYDHARPIQSRIDAVNRLAKEGHTIVIDTARGTMTGEPWGARTLAQLQEWGVDFDKLIVGRKAYGDWYVDDKAISAEGFFACES